MTDFELDVDPALVAAVLELEAHASEEGWDAAPRLFALVPTAVLVASEPDLAVSTGLDDPGLIGSLTPVEQESPDTDIEAVLSSILWPAGVVGCAVIVERLVLPSHVHVDMPGDAAEAAAYVAAHPAREEVRIVAGATREGATYCAVRMRAHDDAASVLAGPDLVPPLLTLLASTLEEEMA